MVEGQGFRDELKNFEKKNAIIIGMSADSVQRQKNFSEKQGFQFQLLSDESKDVLKAYEAWG
ncbi:MAG: redoxin domain-containing protein, partial [Candidatus Marinimicrobia bacterium]|nr:redoxin domain-containing protein [Candidatus Neomarinimicrobiota bacterium]